MRKGRFVFGVVAALSIGCSAPRTVELPPSRVADAGALSTPSPAEIKIDVVTLPMPQSPTGAVCSMGRIASLEKAILERPSDSSERVTSAPWDHTSSPARLDRLTERFALREPELALLRKNGFVVLDRLAFDSYTVAFHELYQSELPLYVSIDAILHTVFVSHDELVERVEIARVIPALDRALSKMQGKLKERAYPAEIAEDLEVYLSVGRALRSGKAPTSEAAKQLFARTTKANELAEVSLFGRDRVIDFSQYAPRGHYAKNERLQRFFRAAMWASRLEFNLVSRSSRSSQPGITPNPEETPREAMAALALADLADASGALADIQSIDRGWGALAGAREDVPLEKLAEIVKADGISFEKMKAAIGSSFKRTTRLHYMPQGSTELPAIATLIGPRVVPDSAATRPLVHGELSNRYEIGAADVAFMLGHDRAKTFLAKDIGEFPGLPAALEKSRAIAMKPSTGTDVYGAWLDTVRTLSDKGEGQTLPSYMTTDAFKDLRINETVAGYGQIRHNYVLIAGQPYDEGACAIPDGFVDPNVKAWDSLVAYAERSKKAFAELDPRDDTKAQSYFDRLAKIAKVLSAIASEEVKGKTLSPEALAFLSTVVEIHSDDIGTGYATGYNGWYFDLFLSRPSGTTSPPPGHPEEPSMKYAGFIADYYTSVNTGRVSYVGATAPRLGIFVVDTNGPPRVVIGPVAQAFEHRAPLDKRLKDADVPKLEQTKVTTAPWASSYEAPAPEEPPVVIDVSMGGDDREKGHTAPVEVTLKSTRPLGPVKVVLMDHNRRKVAEQTKEVSGKNARFAFPARVQRIPSTPMGWRLGTEMVAVTIGEWTGYVDLYGRFGPVGFGGMKPPAPPP